MLVHPSNQAFKATAHVSYWQANQTAFSSFLKLPNVKKKVPNVSNPNHFVTPLTIPSMGEWGHLRPTHNLKSCLMSHHAPHMGICGPRESTSLNDWTILYMKGEEKRYSFEFILSQIWHFLRTKHWLRHQSYFSLACSNKLLWLAVFYFASYTLSTRPSFVRPHLLKIVSARYKWDLGVTFWCSFWYLFVVVNCQS